MSDLAAGYIVSSIHTTPAGLVAIEIIAPGWQRMHVVAPRKRTGTAELDTMIRRSIAARENPKPVPPTYT